MLVLTQIAFGSAILVGGTMMQIVVIVWVIRALRQSQAFTAEPTLKGAFKGSTVVFVPLILAHTVHIYAWAIALWLVGALPGYEEPIYFSIATYTTVGYGDVTLAKGFRIFGSMAGVHGILAFGLTTAFLVGLLSRIVAALREDQP